MQSLRLRLALPLLLLALAGCATQPMPGYQNAFKGYKVPQPLIEQITAKLREYGLPNATVGRDSVGRVRLGGRYRNDDEVEKAFIIVQSVVGLKSTSPFYPDNVQEKNWEQEASRAMAEHIRARSANAAPAAKRAFVVGINHFADNRHLNNIQGEDDAIVVRKYLERAGYAITSLMGEQATKRNIETALQRFEREVGPDDSVFIYVSSHGAPPVPAATGKDERHMSIAAYDSGDTGGHHSHDQTDFLVHLQQTSVRDTLLQDVARKPSRTTRVFIDTCYSGEILRDIPDSSEGYAVRTNGGKAEREGVSLAAWSGQQYTAKGIFLASQAAPVGKSSAAPIDRNRVGYTIITATSEGQESLGPNTAVGVFDSPVNPGTPLRGSFFTQAFFAYLGQHGGQIQPAFEEARSFTEKTALSVTHGDQQQVPRQFSTIPAPLNNLYQ
jgi:hypothetical protein